MFAFPKRLLFNAGLTYEFPYLGLGLFILLFAIVVVIEAKVLRKHFVEFSMAKSILFSFLLNVISSIFGIPLLIKVQIISSNSESGQINFFESMVLAYILTVVVELFTLFLLHKPRPTLKKSFIYSLEANIISYLVIILLPLSIIFIVMMVS
jgi:hypothetical protein